MTHNIGGFTQELYDTFVDWLDARCEADLVLIQETHWGLGREESRWTLKNWLVISSPDAAARFSGVAVFMRRSRFSDHQVSHVVWIPGRLIIACPGTPQVNLDVVAGYQWVAREKSVERIQRLRHRFWTQLSLLLQRLPTRRVLVMGADINVHCRPIPGHIGRALLRARRAPDLEFEELVNERQLVLLNSWGRAAPSRCKTFEHGSTASQLDFLVTWRPSRASVLKNGSASSPGSCAVAQRT